MRRLRQERRRDRRDSRTGAALAIVLVLIGLFTVLCQTLTMLVAIQHRQVFDQADQAQARRLAEAGLMRAAAAIEFEPGWSGETWKPELPSGESATIQLAVKRDSDRVFLVAEAAFTTSGGRIHKSHQTLDVPQASVSEVPEGPTP